MLTDLAPGGAKFEAGRSLQGKLGYGMALFGDRFTGRPNLGFGLNGGSARDYRVGWRLILGRSSGPSFEVNIDAMRREAANDNARAEHGAILRGVLRW